MVSVTADEVLPWMVFPNEEKLRRRHGALLRVCERLENSAEVVDGISKSDLHLLVDHSLAAHWDATVEEGVRQGAVAGALLKVVCDLHLVGEEEPSLNKAVAIYKDFALGKKYGTTEKPLPYSRQTILTCWYTAKSVAHYWAALELAKLADSPYACDRRDVFRSPDDFKKFLLYSGRYAQFAATFVPKRAKPPHPLVQRQDQVLVGL